MPTLQRTADILTKFLDVRKLISLLYGLHLRVKLEKGLIKLKQATLSYYPHGRFMDLLMSIMAIPFSPPIFGSSSIAQLNSFSRQVVSHSCLLRTWGVVREQRLPLERVHVHERII